jgi:hypothetical protein
MPINTKGDIINQTITDVQVGAGIMPNPEGSTAASQNEITVVLGNGKQLRVRAFTMGGGPVLVAHLEKNVQAVDEQILP